MPSGRSGSADARRFLRTGERRLGAGAGPVGAEQLAGNVGEWVATPYHRKPGWVALRGGGWGNNPYGLRVSYRHGNPPDIGAFPQPGKLKQFAQDGELIEVPDDVAGPSGDGPDGQAQRRRMHLGPQQVVATVGQVAAEVRAYRSPEPYKGKGVRYADEVVKLKETKKK